MSLFQVGDRVQNANGRQGEVVEVKEGVFYYVRFDGQKIAPNRMIPEADLGEIPVLPETPEQIAQRIAAASQLTGMRLRQLEREIAQALTVDRAHFVKEARPQKEE
jgi:hypothetical protein